MADTILKVEDLTLQITTPNGPAPAVRGLSFSIGKGECFCLVGESGCGKTITALSILGLLQHPPFLPPMGSILFHGEDLLGLREEELRRIRGRRISMVFQEPMTALNPVMTIRAQIDELLEEHTELDREQREKRVLQALTEAGIPDPAQRAAAYPHQLSGGLRQRAMIAMAIACEPELIIADEPTTALDVTIQAKILKLLKRLQQEKGLSLLLITHNLGIVANMGDRVAVMYAGKMVEQATVNEIFENPRHPYTKGLLKAMPYRLPKGQRRLHSIKGRVPALHELGKGCPFFKRCPSKMDLCSREDPPLERIGEALCACHLFRV